MQLINPDTFIHKKFTEAARGTRFVFNEISQKSIDKHPYFGYGPENYQIAFQENLNPEMALPKYGTEVWTDRAHNIYYDTGVSGGYPAIVFYALFLFSVLYGLYNLKNKDILTNFQISILGGLLVGYVFQNLFVFDSSLSIMVLYVLAGIIFVKNDTSELEKKIPKVENEFIKEGLPVILFVCCLLSLIFFVFRPMQKILRYYSVAQMSMDTRGIHFKDLIGGSNIGEAWDISEIGNHIYKLYNADILKIKNDPSLASYGVSDIKGLIDYLEVIQSKNKTDARLDITIVSLYNTLNFLTNNPYDPILGDRMIGILEHAKTISPNNPAIYWVMAQTYVWKADYNAVVDSYKKAIALDPRIPESHRLLLNFAKNTENKKLYGEALAEALKNIPDFKLE